MTTYLITRHSGAVDWAARHGISVDRTMSHLRIEDIRSGDVVIGILPVHLACEICTKPARYIQIAMDLPEECRGIELTADAMERYNARLAEYHVQRV